MGKDFAPGQFWFGCQFMKSAIILDEQLEISVPHERQVKLKSQTIQPTAREEAGRRIYAWKTSHLESESLEKQKEDYAYDFMRGLLPPPDALISGFRHGRKWADGMTVCNEKKSSPRQR
jgi:hypothetical protein